MDYPDLPMVSYTSYKSPIAMDKRRKCAMMVSGSSMSMFLSSKISNPIDKFTAETQKLDLQLRYILNPRYMIPSVNFDFDNNREIDCHSSFVMDQSMAQACDHSKIGQNAVQNNKLNNNGTHKDVNHNISDYINEGCVTIDSFDNDGTPKNNANPGNSILRYKIYIVNSGLDNAAQSIKSKQGNKRVIFNVYRVMPCTARRSRTNPPIAINDDLLKLDMGLRNIFNRNQ